MSMLHPRPGPHPVHTVHRVSAVAIGAFLILFAVLGITQDQALLSTQGSSVMGLSSNGLLSVVSLIVGVVLVGSATRSGSTASTISIVVGGLFLLSGLVNMMVLGTAMNILAFRLPNVVFSVAVGTVLLILGSYGRISGGLPPSNPYYRKAAEDIPAPRPEAPDESARDIAARAELAAAERAYALHYATPEQLRRLALVHVHRSAEDRRRAWLSSSTDAAAGADP